MNTITENHPYKNSLLTIILPLIKDRVVQAMLIMTVLLAIIDLPQLSPSVHFTLQSLWEMLPFFAIAIAMAAGAKATGADSLIAAAFSGHPLRATILAALVGAISPFCSCGVIPLIAALLGAGVPLAPGNGVLDRFADHGSGNVHTDGSRHRTEFRAGENPGSDRNGTDGGLCSAGDPALWRSE